MFPDSTGLVAWLLVAVPVSLFATTLVRGRGYGLAADIALGAAGAVLGVVAIGWLRIQEQAGFLAGLLATVAGAVLLPALTRFTPHRSAD
jgi:uncharacterized membrane protein YeaQ/YmgE (transglycosylase-associated protein family)